MIDRSRVGRPWAGSEPQRRIERCRRFARASGIRLSGRGIEAEQEAFALDLRVERLWSQGADRLAATPSRRHETGGPQPAKVPAHERLRQADVLDEIGHGGGAVRQPADDSQAVDVGERLVEPAEVTQIVGLVDDGGEGRAKSGG